MMTSAIESRTGNGLALLANKCAARTFDISSGMVYASIRDQIVRAQLLIRDLKASDSQCKRLLIVGAGVAGVSAATYASLLDIECVVLETELSPFHLQSTVNTRFISPFMYEWPSVVSAFHNYPEIEAGLCHALDSTPSWKADAPISASALARQLQEWLLHHNSVGSVPRYVFGMNADAARAYVKQFVTQVSKLHLASATTEASPLSLPNSYTGLDGNKVVTNGASFLPDYIILAVGMGRERVFLIDDTPDGIRGLPFWRDDDLRDSHSMNIPIGVFGGGDGALQDVLRLTTVHDHPLDFINALEQGGDSIREEINTIRSQLESLEQQSRLLACWSSGAVYDLIDSRCEALCNGLVKMPKVSEKVLLQIRSGKGAVHHVFKENRFGKAYLLNRFCVHLIYACLQQGSQAGKVAYTRLANTEVKSAIEIDGRFDVSLSNGQTLKIERVVVRYGASQEDLKKRQLVTLSEATMTDRMSMAAIPLPYVVAQ